VGTDRTQALAGVHPEGHLTVDLDAPEETAQQIVGAPHRPFTAIVAVDDEGLQVAALASAALGLKHHSPDAVRVARDKLAMRRRLEAISGGRPWFTAIPLAAKLEFAPRSVRYPCVLKPRNRSASQGVIRANNPFEFVEAFRRVHDLLSAGPVGRAGEDDILVEEFIPGPEMAVEGLVTNGVLRVLAIFDKPDPLDGPLFEETIYVTPSQIGDVDRAAVEGWSARSSRPSASATGRFTRRSGSRRRGRGSSRSRLARSVRLCSRAPLRGRCVARGSPASPRDRGVGRRVRTRVAGRRRDDGADPTRRLAACGPWDRPCARGRTSRTCA
jgi:hypothetical protein